MYAPIRTRPLRLALVGAAILLGACDKSITSPADARAAKPDKLLRCCLGPYWARQDLPFSPAAINAAGSIVGTSGSEAVLWQSGVLDTLPHGNGLPGPYTAVAITPNGLILGTGNGHAVYWFSTSSPPVDITSGSPYGAAFYPTAMNDSYNVVGLLYGGVNVQAMRWSPSTGFVTIGGSFGISGFDQWVVTSINASGGAAGYHYLYNSGTSLPLRWGSTGGPVQLAAPIDLNGWPSGRGVSIDPSGNVFGFTSAGATVWNTSGTGTVVTGLPAQPSVRSDMGRFAGVGYNGGVQQVFTSFNGALTWLSSADASTPTVVGVNPCGEVVARRATSPASGSVWYRTGGIVFGSTCDVQPTLLLLADRKK